MTSTQELVNVDLRTILEAQGGDYLAAYEAIVERAETEARQTKIVNRSGRVERFKDAVAKRDRTLLARANKTMKNFMKLVRLNADLAADDPRMMTVVESENLMEEALSIKEIKDIVDARWEEIKDHAFAHMTEQFAAEGEQFPEHINGSIDVPKFGYRFAREGAGRKDPELDEKALKALVGPEVWARISDVEIIPAQRVETVDIPALLAYAQNVDPTVLEHLKKSLKVGEWKKPRLNVREL